MVSKYQSRLDWWVTFIGCPLNRRDLKVYFLQHNPSHFFFFYKIKPWRCIEGTLFTTLQYYRQNADVCFLISLNHDYRGKTKKCEASNYLKMQHKYETSLKKQWVDAVLHDLIPKTFHTFTRKEKPPVLTGFSCNVQLEDPPVEKNKRTLIKQQSMFVARSCILSWFQLHALPFPLFAPLLLPLPPDNSVRQWKAATVVVCK